MENNSQEKKKINIKKSFFILSITPYIIFLILGMYNCVTNSLENKYLDLYSLIEPLDQFWFEFIINFNVFFIVLTIFSISYPIYYLLDIYNLKKINNNSKTKISIAFILYILSFIPYFFLIYSCIFGIDFGFFGNTSTYYGFEALFIAIIIGSIVPVYPIVLIFQIVYIVKRYKFFSAQVRKIIKGIVIFIISLILIPSFIYLVKEKNTLNTTFNSDKIVIENYLITEFGKDHYEDMEILENTSLSKRYIIKTPLLEYGFSIELNDDRTSVISSTFYNDFISDNDMEEMLNQYLANIYNLPNNIKLETSISSINIDIKKYDEDFDLRSLLSDCKYNINSVVIYTNALDKQNVIETIKDFYINYSEILDEYHPGDRVVFNLKIKENDFFRVDIIKPSDQEDVLTIIFWSLSNEKEYVDLSS